VIFRLVLYSAFTRAARSKEYLLDFDSSVEENETRYLQSSGGWILPLFECHHYFDVRMPCIVGNPEGVSVLRSER
jgi:hypothetical protein